MLYTEALAGAFTWRCWTAPHQPIAGASSGQLPQAPGLTPRPWAPAGILAPRAPWRPGSASRPRSRVWPERAPWCRALSCLPFGSVQVGGWMPGRGWGWGRKGTQYLRRRSQDPGSGEEGTSPPHHWGYSCRGQAPPLWPARAVALPSGAAGIFRACPAKPAPDRRPPTPSSSWAGSWPCPHFSPLHPGLCSCFRNNGTWVPRPLGTHPSGIIGELAPMLSAGTAQDPALPGAVSPWAAGTRPRLEIGRAHV